MIRSLLKIGLLLVAGIIVYNFFFGTDAEKEQSRKIFGQVRGLAKETVELVKAEREKFDAGKYDKALEKIGGVYRSLRDKAEYLDKKVLTRLDDLEKRKAALQEELDQIESDEAAPAPEPKPKKGLKRDAKTEEATAAKAADLQRRKAELQKEMDKLARETEQLATEAEQGIED